MSHTTVLYKYGKRRSNFWGRFYYKKSITIETGSHVYIEIQTHAVFLYGHDGQQHGSLARAPNDDHDEDVANMAAILQLKPSHVILVYSVYF